MGTDLRGISRKIGHSFQIGGNCSDGKCFSNQDSLAVEEAKKEAVKPVSTNGECVPAGSRASLQAVKCNEAFVWCKTGQR